MEETYVDERPGNDPRCPKQRRDDPGDDDHDDSTLRGATYSVLERTSYTHVPVEADQQQVSYRRVTYCVVQRQPRVTYHRPCSDSQYTLS